MSRGFSNLNVVVDPLDEVGVLEGDRPDEGEEGVRGVNEGRDARVPDLDKLAEEKGGSAGVPELGNECSAGEDARVGRVVREDGREDFGGEERGTAGRFGWVCVG